MFNFLKKKSHDKEDKNIPSLKNYNTKEFEEETNKLIEYINNNFDFNKKTFLIIDDNKGIVSFLEDDLDFLEERGVLDLYNMNVLRISGIYAAFILDKLYQKYNKLNIKWAIIDITFGAIICKDDEYLKYSGIDVYKMIKKHEDDFEYVFYTGNALNPYIDSNKKIIDEYLEASGRKINEKILFKTSKSIDERREYFANYFFNQNILG